MERCPTGETIWDALPLNETCFLSQIRIGLIFQHQTGTSLSFKVCFTYTWLVIDTQSRTSKRRYCSQGNPFQVKKSVGPCQTLLSPVWCFRGLLGKICSRILTVTDSMLTRVYWNPPPVLVSVILFNSLYSTPFNSTPQNDESPRFFFKNFTRLSDVVLDYLSLGESLEWKRRKQLLLPSILNSLQWEISGCPSQIKQNTYFGIDHRFSWTTGTILTFSGAICRPPSTIVQRGTRKKWSGNLTSKVFPLL